MAKDSVIHTIDYRTAYKYKHQHEYKYQKDSSGIRDTDHNAEQDDKDDHQHK